ncbi:MAG: threonylcarbamoyl-AMP synthase [Dehalococcoidia bacterium]|nr:threonylcarbamoyl-AMP synthase [Dehalococcoidia bacterium]
MRILTGGGVIVFPTDTVYGLGADAFNSRGVDRIYEIKKRPRHLPFPLLLAETSQLSMVAEAFGDLGRFLARRFWPGGLTLVLPRLASVPSCLGKGPTIAVRVPDHPVSLSLIRSLGRPIIGTSANISGRASCLCANEARRQLGDAVDLIIDGGDCPGGTESTIVDITNGTPVVLREGMVGRTEIDQAYAEYCEAMKNAHRHRL